MQRTLKRELKVLEIVKSEAIEAPKRTRVLPRREFSPRTGSAHGIFIDGGARMASQGEEVPRLGGGDRGGLHGLLRFLPKSTLLSRRRPLTPHSKRVSIGGAVRAGALSLRFGRPASVFSPSKVDRAGQDQRGLSSNLVLTRKGLDIFRGDARSGI